MIPPQARTRVMFVPVFSCAYMISVLGKPYGHGIIYQDHEKSIKRINMTILGSTGTSETVRGDASRVKVGLAPPNDLLDIHRSFRSAASPDSDLVFVPELRPLF